MQKVDQPDQKWLHVVGQTQDFSLWPVSKLGFQELQLSQLEPQPDTTDHLSDILKVLKKTA